MSEANWMSEMAADSPDNKTVDSTDKLKYLTDLCKQLEDKQEALEEAQEEVKKIEESIRHLSSVVIPGVFEELGVKKITLLNGREVTIKTDWTGSITEENSMAAFNWLEEKGFDSIIKKNVTINLKKGESEKADKIREWLVANGIFNFKEKPSVHYSTLKSFIREQKEKGTDLPDELFGVYQIKETKIK